MNYSKYIKYTAVLAIGFSFTACEPEFDNEVRDGVQFTSGEADFGNFVAVGNSLTAGFADGALYIDGQKNSLPKIMAGQFALAGGGTFTQPLVADNLGGLKVGGTQVRDNRFVLRLNADGTPQGPVVLQGDPTTDSANFITGPFNNMAVPGAKSFHLGLEGYGALNPYFGRFASVSTASVLGDAVAQDPTFFLLWIGNNDALSFAISGGTGVDQTGNLNPNTYGGDDITDPNVFALSYSGYLQTLTANGAKGVVANLPDVTSIPFFTTVPYNAIPLDAPTAAAVNGAYAAYNGGIQQALAALSSSGLFTEEEANRRAINFTTGQNAVVIFDEDLTDLGAINPTFAGLPKYRQATAEDLLVFTSQTVIGTLADANDPLSVIGVGVPLEDKWVLTPEEQQTITTAQTAYNATIASLAQQFDLAFYDAKSALAQVANSGVMIDEGLVTDTYASGGAFSLDGVHPTARGYAISANGFIDAINQKYNATIPKVNPGTYTTIFVE